MRKIFALAAVAILCSGAAFAEFYNRAPDTLPGTTPEMRNPEYWISKVKNPDAVIMPVNVILAKNADYVKRMSVAEPFKGEDPDRIPKDLDRWPGRFIVPPQIEKLSPAELAKTVKTEIAKDVNFIRGKYLREVTGLKADGQKFGNMLGIEYSTRELDSFENEMALDKVGDSVKPVYGITVVNARLRIVPTLKGEQIGMMENGKTRWDVWNVNLVRIGQPVTVLHASKSGGYVFVMSGEGYGWIRSEEVAFGKKEEIEAYGKSADFVVCTGDIVPFYSDSSCKYASGWMRMGDKLPLASKTTPNIIKAPVRKSNGQFETAPVYLAKDADVSIGYLPYTRRNIAVTSFKLLDNFYDWTMGWYGRNHETTMRDVFACFGFQLPFNAELFTFYGNGDKRVVRPAEGKEAQFKAILDHEPLITIQTCGGGHNHLLLGEYNGEPIVFDTNGYGYDEGGKRYEVRRQSVSSIYLPEYFLKTPFTIMELK